ncbi:MAG: ParB-like nuclease domain-containing protein [Sedimentisphaerales bacterium]|nr:ParB-like nuclease domain-containing protein [Sedimentisphaerales bacterium]
MSSKIKQIALDKLLPHPDNSNRMSRAAFAKLARNIERTGHYEPLVVRPHPGKRGLFQIINGHHRCQALRKLRHAAADVVVWDVDDEQTDILLLTLNRLGGRDTLSKKLELLRRLRRRQSPRDLAKLLPQTRGQLERLMASRPMSAKTIRQGDDFAIPMVFFVDKTQQQAIEQALATTGACPNATTRAARRAVGLTRIANCFLDQAENADDPA